jgi:hypothetical protein
LSPTRLAYTQQQVNPLAEDPKALLKRIIDTKGGLDALKRIRTVVADEDRTIVTPSGRTPLPTKTYVIYPDKFRVDSVLAGQQIVHTYNSGAAWVKDLGGVSAAPVAMRNDFAATARRDTYPMLIAAAEGRLMLRLLPQETRETEVLQVLEVTGGDFPAVRLYVDTHFRIVRQSYAASGPDGLPMKIEEVFSDYRAVDNVAVPFKASVLSNGRVIIERTIKSVSFNTRIDEKLFDQPL